MSKTQTKITTVGERFRRARTGQKMTQGEVAKRLGHSTNQYVSNLERGLCAPSMETICKLVKIYSMDKKARFRFVLREYKAVLARQMKIR